MMFFHSNDPSLTWLVILQSGNWKLAYMFMYTVLNNMHDDEKQVEYSNGKPRYCVTETYQLFLHTL